LTDFAAVRVISFAQSRDGKKLAAARGEITSDVVLISVKMKANGPLEKYVSAGMLRALVQRRLIT